jgi:beta-glucoside transcriptional antiterminator (fragment)
MAFKCEEVDKKLRKQIEEENGILTGIKEISSWMIDEERSIVVWMQPNTLKKIDGDFSEDLWIKFLKTKSNDIARFTVMPGESERVDTPDGKCKMIYRWDKILSFWIGKSRIGKNMDYNEMLSILKEALTCRDGARNEKCPDFSVEFNF